MPTGAANAAVAASDAPDARRRFRWLTNSMSGLVSMVLHIGLFLFMALMSYGGHGIEGIGDDVLIGEIPSEQLSTMQEEELKPDDITRDPAKSRDVEEMVEVETPTSAAARDASSEELLAATPSPSGGNTGSFDVGTVTVGGGSMAGGGNWDGMLQQLRRNGLDIVITFDSTGSMAGEINEVKRQIKRIGGTLVKMIPKARISICTYRDEGDEYVVKGLPLTGDIQAVDEYLSKIRAGGGGDEPEAVHEGLRWSMSYNEFNPRARKVILVFGDAPPHQEHLKTCLKLASGFNQQQKGIVSTVTCRDRERIREFIEIAYAGGGEAFLSADERQIMTQLLVLVFGSQHRSKVIEAFKLMEK